MFIEKKKRNKLRMEKMAVILTSSSGGPQSKQCELYKNVTKDLISYFTIHKAR